MKLNEEIHRIKGIMGINEDYYAGQSISEFLETFKEKYKNRTFIWLDTETTGLNVYDNQITELAAVATDTEFNELDTFHKKMKLDMSQIKDIEMTRTKVFPMTRHGEKGGKYYDERKTIDEFFDWVDTFDSPVLVAQNASFDLKYLAVRGDMKLKYDAIDTKKIIEMFFIPAIQQLSDENDDEAKEILRKLPIRKELPSSSMGNIAPSLKVSAEGWHSAITDVKMMINMFKKIMDYLESVKDTSIRNYQGKRLVSYRKK